MRNPYTHKIQCQALMAGFTPGCTACEWEDRHLAQAITSRNTEIDLEVRAERLQSELDAIHQLKTAKASYGDDIYEDGSILTFEKVLDRKNPRAKAYTYAALKCNDFWYTTGPVNGRGNSPWTWDELTNWMAKGNSVTGLWYVTNMVPVEA